jgi:hypothetical protein
MVAKNKTTPSATAILYNAVLDNQSGNVYIHSHLDYLSKLKTTLTLVHYSILTSSRQEGLLSSKTTVKRLF